jgi:uncharacterized protein YgfB (UPF0149 family)
VTAAPRNGQESSLRERIESLFGSANIMASAAEIHGTICGAACGTDAPPAEYWAEALLDEANMPAALYRECLDLLSTLSARFARDLDSEELAFVMWLPDDAASLAARVEALGQWCRGFLFGLGTAAPADASLSPEGREFLADLARISRVDCRIPRAAESDERAYVELVEYVRVGALLLRAERRSREREVSDAKE